MTPANSAVRPIRTFCVDLFRSDPGRREESGALTDEANGRLLPAPGPYAM